MGKKVLITGGRRLDGEVMVGGCKNAVLPILAATVLTGKRSVIFDCPNISDTHVSIEILRYLGCTVEYDGATIVVDSAGIDFAALPDHHVGKMRSSIIFSGALLSRFGRIDTISPGGCDIGSRPISLHINAFKQMGVIVESPVRIVGATAPGRPLTGSKIALDFPSVGATQNIILAAVLAQGTTIITNAAKEPEIVDLQRFLNAAGAKVAGAGTSTVVVEGVKDLKDVEYTIMPDRIVAGTYLAAGAIAGGHIKLKNVKPADIVPVVKNLDAMGAEIFYQENEITLKAAGRPNALPLLATGPYPAFPTDMQPQFTALLATASGHSIIMENIFESRDAHVYELVKMGADIEVFNSNRFHIKGVSRLQGATVSAKDLRGGAALILAGLAADGQTTIEGFSYVERGYENIISDLQSLGADIHYAAK